MVENRISETAGRRESSEDDLSLRFTQLLRDGRRGLYPPSAEPGPATEQYGDAPFGFARAVANQTTLRFDEVRDLPQTALRGTIRQRRPGLGGELGDRRRRVAQPQLGDLRQVRRQRVEPDAADRLELFVRGARRAHEVRLVCVR